MKPWASQPKVLPLRALGLGMVEGLGFRAWGLGFRGVKGLGVLRVKGLWFRV